ncbi:MAG: DUF4886 domain-containing protein [Bacteroidota bacterium]
MMNKNQFKLLGFTFLLLFLLGDVQGQEAKRILFVGNSFTYFFNLPQVVMAMGEDQNVALITRQSTVGGSNLEQHWKEERNTRTRQLLENEKWDYVVFNNHSLSSIDTPDSFMEYGRKFADLVKEKGAQPIFMMTWAYYSNPLMQKEITRMHRKLAEETGAGLVPCGLLFDSARKWRPDLDLFFDDKHPSSNGTYMLGLTFFKYFTRKSVMDIPYRITTTDKDGEKLYLLFMLQEDAIFVKQLVEEFDFQTLTK